MLIIGRCICFLAHVTGRRDLLTWISIIFECLNLALESITVGSIEEMINIGGVMDRDTTILRANHGSSLFGLIYGGGQDIGATWLQLGVE